MKDDDTSVMSFCEAAIVVLSPRHDTTLSIVKYLSYMKLEDMLDDNPSASDCAAAIVWLGPFVFARSAVL